MGPGMVYREAYDEIGFPSKRCCQAQLGMAVSGMMLPTKLIKTKQVLFSRHVPKRRCGFEDDGVKNGEGWGRKNWTFDVKGGFCRSERGTKLKMRRGRKRERCVSINTWTLFLFNFFFFKKKKNFFFFFIFLFCFLFFFFFFFSFFFSFFFFFFFFCFFFFFFCFFFFFLENCFNALR